jgi:hypothetical protein
MPVCIYEQLVRPKPRGDPGKQRKHEGAPQEERISEAAASSGERRAQSWRSRSCCGRFKCNPAVQEEFVSHQKLGSAVTSRGRQGPCHFCPHARAQGMGRGAPQGHHRDTTGTPQGKAIDYWRVTYLHKNGQAIIYGDAVGHNDNAWTRSASLARSTRRAAS